MEVVFREFRTADIDGLFALDYRCYKPPYRFGYQQMLLTLQDKHISSMVIENEEEQEIVGGLILRSDLPNKQVVIVSLMVDRDFRRNGLGRRLLAWGEKLGRAGNWDALLLPLESENEAGKAFLEACGLEPSDISAPWFNSPTEGKLWRRTLSENAMPEENMVSDKNPAENKSSETHDPLPRTGGAERAEEA